MKTLTRVLTVAALALACGTAAHAHHSHSMFDMTREVSVTGTVTSFSYRNPHVFLYLDVKNEDGRGRVLGGRDVEHLEHAEPRGIYLSTFKPGDVVTVKINPLKDGRLGGNYTSVTAADGKTYE